MVYNVARLNNLDKETNMQNEVPPVNSEQPLSEDTPQSPELNNDSQPLENKPKNKKKVILLVVLIAVLLLGGGYTAWALFIRKDTKPVATTNTEQQQQVVEEPKKPTFSKVIVLVEGDDVLLLDPATNKTEKIIDGVGAGIQTGCGMEGCIRYVDLAPDNSKVAVNYLDDGNKQAAVGYYDRETKKVVTIAKGDTPKWSPQGNRIAYYDKEAVKVYDLDTKKTVAIKDTKQPVDNNGYPTATPLLMGWKSNDELIFDAREDSDDVTFSLGNAVTGEKSKLRIQTLSDGQSLRNGLVSYDGSKVLAFVDKDPGYDVGVMGVDGTSFKSVSGNSAARWAGSGFHIAGWSPDSQKVIVIDNFIGATPSAGQRAKAEYQVKDLQGNQLYAITGERAQQVSEYNGQIGACWIDNTLYLLFYIDNGNPYLGAYDVSSKKVTKVYSFSTSPIGGLGCPR